MDPFRLRVLIAPAMASLFRMLSLGAFMVQRPEPVGMHLLLPQVRMIPFENCEDARALIVFIQKDGIIRINEMQVRPE